MSTTPVSRLWARIHPGRSPLARVWDRVEAFVLVLALAVPLVALPISAAIGSDTYAHQLRVAEQQMSTRYRANAVLLENVPASPTGGVYGAADPDAWKAAAQWQSSDGTRHTGEITAKAGTRANTSVPVWLDRSGQVVTPPMTPEQALREAVSTALTTWLAVVAACGITFWMSRRLLDRARDRQWQREWESVSRQWSGSE